MKNLGTRKVCSFCFDFCSVPKCSSPWHRRTTEQDLQTLPCMVSQNLNVAPVKQRQKYNAYLFLNGVHSIGTAWYFPHLYHLLPSVSHVLASSQGDVAVKSHCQVVGVIQRQSRINVDCFLRQTRSAENWLRIVESDLCAIGSQTTPFMVFPQ